MGDRSNNSDRTEPAAAGRCRLAYGLAIDSEIELPELPLTDREADVVVRLGKVERWPDVIPEVGAGFWQDGDEACHLLDGVAAFHVRAGQEVTVEPVEGASEYSLRLSILGPVMALVHHLRGRFVMHASAVAVDGVGIAFTGDRRMGKSTTAAGFVRRGFDFVSEDALVLDLDDDGCVAWPTYPQIKLWNDAARQFGLVPDEMPLIHPQLEKRAWRFPERFKSAPVPLRAMIVLDGGEEIRFAPISPMELLPHILRNWYGARYQSVMLSSIDQGEHFRNCAQLARLPLTGLLERPVDISRLDEVIDVVLENLNGVRLPGAEKDGKPR